MSGKPFVALAVATSFSMLAIGSAVAASDNRNDDRGNRDRDGVLPCSLVGVNPAYHPEIFGNAAAAASYGFVRSADGTWHVRCSGAGAPAAAGNYASTIQKAPGHHRKRLKP